MKKAPKKSPQPQVAPFSDDLYRQVVENAPTAKVLADRRGNIVLVNKKAEQLFGYLREELIGQPVELLLPERFRAGHVGYREGYAKKPEARAMGAGRDLFALRKDGREIPVEIGLNPIETREQVYILAAIIDITERLELQRQVSQSETMAAVGTMAAVLAHEIRNPLGSVVMAAKSLTRHDLTKDERETVFSVLSEESQRLNRTLQDFLQFARPREPKRELSDLNRLISEIVQALKTDVELTGGVEVELALDPKLPRFSHDPDQVRQVLWNLMLNAVESMNGKGTLRVSTAAEGRSVVCRVVDTGPGLDPATAGRIFDPFFTTKKKGTGLGLAICQSIVGAHGGRIVAENEPEAGARFSVVFPV